MSANEASYENNSDPPSFKVRFVDNLTKKDETFFSVFVGSGFETISFTFVLERVRLLMMEPTICKVYSTGMEDEDNHSIV